MTQQSLPSYRAIFDRLKDEDVCELILIYVTLLKFTTFSLYNGTLNIDLHC